ALWQRARQFREFLFPRSKIRHSGRGGGSGRVLLSEIGDALAERAELGVSGRYAVPCLHPAALEGLQARPILLLLLSLLHQGPEWSRLFVRGGGSSPEPFHSAIQA